MKTKFTLIWLVLIMALTPIGNRVYARGLHAAQGSVLHSANIRKVQQFQTGGQDRLGPGEQLAVDQQLTSPNGRFFLLMQRDGNFVLYQRDVGSLWATNTVNSGAIRAALELNGELVLYNANNIPVWKDYDAIGNAALRLNNDGSIVKVLPGNGEVRQWSWTGPIALRPNEQLGIGENLVSAWGQFRLVMQSDGNLVLYYHGVGPLWATGTVGSGAVRAIMQSDGNLVLYRADNTPVWASNTVGQEANLWLGTDGNLSIVRNADKVLVWSTNTAQATLRSQKPLEIDQKLTSRNGQYVLLMQKDGNLVLYEKSGRPLWSSGTAGSGATYAYNSDRLFVGKRSTHVWDSPSFGGNATLKLQDDGNLVAIRDSDGVVVWSTNTGKVVPPPSSPQPTRPTINVDLTDGIRLTGYNFDPNKTVNIRVVVTGSIGGVVDWRTGFSQTVSNSSGRIDTYLNLLRIMPVFNDGYGFLWYGCYPRTETVSITANDGRWDSHYQTELWSNLADFTCPNF